jgi:predicted Fe-Mo cluster-binding NifX family protein
MKIAVASMGNNLDSDISPLLGKSENFIIADLKNGKIEHIKVIENSAKNQT